MEQAQAQHNHNTRDPLVRMARRNREQAAQQMAGFQAALSQAFGRMCADYPGLDGKVVNVVRRSVSLAELVDMAEPGQFLALLDGPDDALGMVWLCPALLAALVEAQTTGQVMPPGASDGPPRLPTRTDAALVAPMVDAFLHHAEERCADLAEGADIGGFLYGSFLDDRRPMGVVLDDVDYNILQLQVSLGNGVVTGYWTVVLPSRVVKNADAPGKGTTTGKNRLTQTVENSPVAVLNAVLCSVQTKLERSAGPFEGRCDLRVPESAFGNTWLDRFGRTQRLPMVGWGKRDGFRAVRLCCRSQTWVAGRFSVCADLAPFQGRFYPTRPSRTRLQKRIQAHRPEFGHGAGRKAKAARSGAALWQIVTGPCGTAAGSAF